MDEHIEYHSEIARFVLDMKTDETYLKAFRIKLANAKVRQDFEWTDQNSESVK